VSCWLLIKKIDNAPPSSAEGGKWLRGEVVHILDGAADYISSGETDTNVFLRFEVTDRTKAEMDQYLDVYNRAINMQVINGPDPQGFRRIQVRNNWANISGAIYIGRGYWQQDGIDAIILGWNTQYPTCNLTTVSFPNQDANGLGDEWICEGTFTSGQAALFEETIIEEGLSVTDKRTYQYMSESFVTFIENAGGVSSGTGQNIANNMLDARST
jgi:hypothetical protein